MATRRAVVTGASSGIGEATVRALRATGWDVVGVARRADRLRALEAETGAVAFAADLTRQEDVDALAAWLAETGPCTPSCTSPAARAAPTASRTRKAADWQWMFEVNVLSAQRLVAALLPQLRGRRHPTATPTRSSSPRRPRRPPTRAAPATTPPRPPRR